VVRPARTPISQDPSLFVCLPLLSVCSLFPRPAIIPSHPRPLTQQTPSRAEQSRAERKREREGGLAEPSVGTQREGDRQVCRG
jgi:hypothetical protein